MSGEAETNKSGWTVDTIHGLMLSKFNALDSLLDERYASQTKAVDAAFVAQQKAMETALTAAETAVRAALEAAEKAVVKAEVATEKRLEGMNEFRAQLSDQALTFMPRSESDLRNAAITDSLETFQTSINSKIDAVAKNLDDKIVRLTTTMDTRFSVQDTRFSTQGNELALGQGRSAGLNAGWGYLVGALGAVSAMIAIIALILK